MQVKQSRFHLSSFIVSFSSFRLHPCSSSWICEPAAAEVVAEGQGEEDQEPEEAGSDDDPCQARAIANVHEVEYDECGLDTGDGQSHNCVQDPAQINQSRINSQESADHQRAEDGEIDFSGNDMFGHDASLC